ncbi:hypothetical protein [Roseomonas sp. USHLN139]|uniref:hypothetical protein n=1 Tax=Roseomonas sp. USHLN139 TaxID=3081298 RepID=UPI003B028DC3
MDLSVMDLPTLQGMKARAMTAYEAVVTGRREVSMSIGANGASRAVGYNTADINWLRSWIADIDRAIAAKTGARFAGRRAIGIGSFGPGRRRWP